jgi:hypothetical protein
MSLRTEGVLHVKFATIIFGGKWGILHGKGKQYFT